MFVGPQKFAQILHIAIQFFHKLFELKYDALHGLVYKIYNGRSRLGTISRSNVDKVSAFRDYSSVLSVQHLGNKILILAIKSNRVRSEMNPTQTWCQLLPNVIIQVVFYWCAPKMSKCQIT